MKERTFEREKNRNEAWDLNHTIDVLQSNLRPILTMRSQQGHLSHDKKHKEKQNIGSECVLPVPGWPLPKIRTGSNVKVAVDSGRIFIP